MSIEKGYFMLRSTSQLHGHRLTALDGEIGHVKDFYFDDKEWAVRYVIVKTGSWLSDRQVLISPRSVGRIDDEGKVILVNLTRKQVEGSPVIDTQKPVSRQYEELYHQHYGYPYYWAGNGLWGMTDIPIWSPFPVLIPAITDLDPVKTANDAWPHLRSINEVKGYHLQAQDGTIGQLCDFMIDEKTWAISRLTIETGHWYAGKKIFLLPKHIDRFSYEDATIFVNLTLDDISGTAKNEVAQLGSVNE
jgi:sporulation protein YlmC with PRC-barrel domain